MAKIHLIEDIAIVDPSKEDTDLYEVCALLQEGSMERTYRKIVCFGSDHCAICNMTVVT